MSFLDFLSFAALTAAAAPPMYFALRLRASNPSFSRIALLLAIALLIHSLFHLVEALAVSPTLVQALEAGSALLLLGFALAYWPLRRRASNGR